MHSKFTQYNAQTPEPHLLRRMKMMFAANVCMHSHHHYFHFHQILNAVFHFPGTESMP